MPFPELDAFAAKLNGMAAALSGEDLKAILDKVGVEAKGDATDAVRGDYGDTSMSHWRRGNPVQMQARYDVSGTEVSIIPTPRSRGPWKVAEDGRHAGVGRSRRGRPGRRVSASRGKRTWTDATDLMVKRTPKRAEDELYRVMNARWGR